MTVASPPKPVDIGMDPEPGIYPGVEDHLYHSWSYASKSRMWRMKHLLEVCPDVKELHQAMQDERPDSDALRFGRAFDDFLFFPQLARQRYAVGPTKTAGTKAWAKEQEENPGITLVTPDEIERIPRMVESILSHPIGHALMTGRGANQVSVVADDEQTGVRCKARIDRWTSFEGESAHVDVKTCRDLDWFHKDAISYGYFIQAAHYVALCEALDRAKGNAPHHRRFLFLVVEKNASREHPERHRVGVYEFDEMQIDSARRIRDVLLAKWKRLFVDGVWPGERPVVQRIYIPESVEHMYGDMPEQRSE